MAAFLPHREEKVRKRKENHMEKAEDYDIVKIEMEDGRTLAYSILAIFDVGESSYAALLPVDEDNDEIVFYGCNEKSEEKELELIEIDEEEEFAVVSEAFLNLMNDFVEEEKYGKDGIK